MFSTLEGTLYVTMSMGPLVHNLIYDLGHFNTLFIVSFGLAIKVEALVSLYIVNLIYGLMLVCLLKGVNTKHTILQ